MGCDYYIQSEIVIEYQAKDGRINTIHMNKSLKRCYIFELPNQDSDDDEDTSYNKYKAEMERIIKDNTYNKMLFENGKWVKESYKLKYETNLMKLHNDISQFIKIYKKYIAWER